MSDEQFWRQIEQAHKAQGYVVFSGDLPRAIGHIFDEVIVRGRPTQLPQPFAVIGASNFDEYFRQMDMLGLSSYATDSHPYFYRAVTE